MKQLKILEYRSKRIKNMKVEKQSHYMICYVILLFFIKLYNELPDYAKQIFVDTMAKLLQAAEQPKSQPRKRHVERLGDKLKQEEDKAKDAI